MHNLIKLKSCLFYLPNMQICGPPIPSNFHFGLVGCRFRLNICNYGKQLQNAWFFPVVRFIYVCGTLVAFRFSSFFESFFLRFVFTFHDRIPGLCKPTRSYVISVYSCSIFRLKSIPIIVSGLLWFRLWRQVIWILYYNFSACHLIPSFSLHTFWSVSFVVGF